MKFQVKHTALLFLALSSAVFSTSALAAVWKPTRSWDAGWEKNYREWVAKEWSRDFFTKPGTAYTGLSLDCADTVYSMRVIFSYENGLPFSMRDPSNPKRVITNEMARFDTLPAQKRIRKFLELIYEVGSTHSLPMDTYPIAIGSDTVTAGTLILTDKANHHSWTIQSLSSYGQPHLVYSSRPAKNRILERSTWPTSPEWVFAAGLNPELTDAGIRAFRHPEDVMKPVWEVPGYSKEQYEIPLRNFFKTVRDRIASSEEPLLDRFKALYVDACAGATERVEAVDEGADLNSKLGATCMDAQQYDDFSTPGRDARLKDALNEVESVSAMYLNTDSGVLTSSTGRASTLSAAGVTECKVTWAPGKSISLSQLYARMKASSVSSNPNESKEVRWGESTSSSEKARRCPKY